MIIDERPGDVEVCGDDLTLSVECPREGSAFNEQLLKLEGLDVEPPIVQLGIELIRERELTLPPRQRPRGWSRRR